MSKFVPLSRSKGICFPDNSSLVFQNKSPCLTRIQNVYHRRQVSIRTVPEAQSGSRILTLNDVYRDVSGPEKLLCIGEKRMFRSNNHRRHQTKRNEFMKYLKERLWIGHIRGNLASVSGRPRLYGMMFDDGFSRTEYFFADISTNGVAETNGCLVFALGERWLLWCTRQAKCGQAAFGDDETEIAREMGQTTRRLDLCTSFVVCRDKIVNDSNNKI